SPAIEIAALAAAVHGKRALRPDRVRALEDPVLPGREAAEDLALERLGAAEAQRGFHARERVRRERGARLERLSHFVLPVDVVGRERHEPGLRRGCGIEILAHAPLEVVNPTGLGKKTAR